jgi:hypothetical protein
MEIKELTLKLAGLTAVTASSIVLTVGNAEAATFTIGGTFSDGGTFSGTFNFDAVSNTYSDFSIMTKAGTAVTSDYTYTSSNSISPSPDQPFFGGIIANTTNTDTFFGIKSVVDSSTTRYLGFQFDSSLAATTMGDEVDITTSFGDELVDGGGAQLRGVTGGSVTAVPEPMTILGSAAALGFGALFRKKFSKKS